MNLDTMIQLVVSAAVFAALYAGHSFGDHWTQSHSQACSKGDRSPQGQYACYMHVASLTLTKVMALAALMAVTGVELPPVATVVALLIDAASHYWADRAAFHPGKRERVTLERLAHRLGKSGFFELGDRKAAPTGTGAYALDQSWHVAWLFVTALIIAGGA